MKFTGVWLVVGSVCFWLAWCLMPGVGVTDTSTIFRLVAQHRDSVFLSVILQLVSAAAYAPGVVGLVSSKAGSNSRATSVGAALLAIGAMGSAADAIFHLVAFEMTDPRVSLQAMDPVMRRLQGPDLALLLPFVLAFFAAHVVLLVAGRAQSKLSRWAFWLLMSLPLVVGALVAVKSAGAISAREVGLGVLLVFNSSLVLHAMSLWAPRDALSVGSQLGRSPAA